MVLDKKTQAKLDKIKAGKTKELIALRNYLTFQHYKDQGMKLQKIADIMGMSLSSMERYNAKYNKELDDKFIKKIKNNYAKRGIILTDIKKYGQQYKKEKEGQV